MVTRAPFPLMSVSVLGLIRTASRVLQHVEYAKVPSTSLARTTVRDALTRKVGSRTFNGT